MLSPGEAVWPPDFSKYNADDLIKALHDESNSINAPKSYRDIITKINNELSTLKQKAALQDQEAESNRARIAALTSKSDSYLKSVVAAEQNYNFLVKLYKKEIKQNADYREKIIELEFALKQLQDSTAAKEHQYKQQEKQTQQAQKQEWEQKQEEYTRALTKNAIGRKNMEDRMMMKENELNELKRRVAEAEAKALQETQLRHEKQQEVEKMTGELNHYRAILTYATQQQKQQQQQQQQQPQQQPQQQQQQYPRFQ